MTEEAKLLEARELNVIKTDRQFCTARFSPGGKFLFTGGYDAVVRRWDLSGNEPQQLDSLEGHHGWVQSLACGSQTDLLFSADSWGQLRAWPYLEERPQPKWQHPQAHDGWIRSLAVSDDGNLVATAGRDRVVCIWSAADGKLLHKLPGHAEDIYAVALHPDNNSAVSSDLLGTVKHWDLSNGTCTREKRFEKMHYHERIQDVAGLRILNFLDDGKTLVCAGCEPTKTGRAFGVPTIQLVDWQSFETRQTLHLGPDKDGFIFDLSWHPDSFFILVTSGPPGASRFLLFRPEDEKPFFENKQMYNCHGLAFDSQSGRIVVVATNRQSQGNGAVLDKEGNYLGNSSPLHLFEIGRQG